MSNPLTSFWDWVDSRSVIRRVVLFVTVWMSWAAFQWAAQFAISTPKSGVEVAAIIAAVTAPISVLQGFIFKVYSDSRAA